MLGAANMEERSIPDAKTFLATLWSLIALYLFVAFVNAAYAVATHSLYNVVLAFGFALMAYGLYVRARSARIISVVILWMFILVAFGPFSPFQASDDIAAGIDRTIGELIITFSAISGLSLWCLHVLGKHKALFGKKSREQQN